MIRQEIPGFEQHPLSCRGQHGPFRFGIAFALMIVIGGVLGASNSAAAAPDEVLGNKGIAYRLFDEVFNAGDLSVAEELFTTGAVIHTPDGRLLGSAGCGEYVSALRTGAPGAAFTIQDTIVSGDTVVVRWTLSGSDGEAASPFATPASVDGIALLRVESYLIVELWMR